MKNAESTLSVFYKILFISCIVGNVAVLITLMMTLVGLFGGVL